MRRFRRTRAGHVAVTLASNEAEILGSLPGQIVQLLEEPARPGAAEDPVVTRLFPRAYLDPTEEEAEAEWRALVLPDLLRQKLDALSVVTDALARARVRRNRVEVDLTDDEAAAWLGALNDLRLVLGTRLEVTDDLDVSAMVDDDARGPEYALYAWLTWIQGELIEVLLF